MLNIYVDWSNLEIEAVSIFYYERYILYYAEVFPRQLAKNCIIVYAAKVGTEVVKLTAEEYNVLRYLPAEE